MKKIIPFLTLFILFGNMVSCEQVRTETNYYKPTIKEEYKEISKDDFVNKVNSNYKSEFGYKYISLKVDWDNPEAEYYYYYVRGEVKEDLSLNNQDQLIQNQVGIGARETNISDIYALDYANPLVRIDEVIKFYANPYSYDFITEDYTGRVIFDDYFMIHKIECMEEGNAITYDFRYYNFEDLPTTTGEISFDSYLDMAYAYLERDKKPYSGVDVNYKVTNGVVNRSEHFDEVNEVNIIEMIYGNAEVEFYREMVFVPPFVGASEAELGIANYTYTRESQVKNEYTIISGEIGEKELAYPLSSLEFDSKKCASSFYPSTLGYIDRKMLNGYVRDSEPVNKKFYANPLRKELEFNRKYSSNYIVYSEYNDRCAITYYKETIEDATYEYRYIYA